MPGIITAVGDGVEGFRPGDAVIVAGARSATRPTSSCPRARRPRPRR
jgi:NADPH:quinone reductase-like Zn-dependent oxidoreductase